MQAFFLISLNIFLIFLCGCSSPQKSITYRSRVPSIEAPLFNENLQLGISTQIESQRFEVAATKNLVDDFAFYRNGDSFTSGESQVSLEGLDIALTGALGADLYAFQAEASFDFIEGKFGLGSLYESSPSSWLLMIGGGLYRTAVRIGSGSCKFFCFSSEEDQKSTRDIENRIETQQSGTESKWSASLGYRFKQKWIVYAGYSQMHYKYFAKITDTTRNPSSLEFNETYDGAGYGLGLGYQFSRHAQMSLAGQTLVMNWNNRRQERGMGVLNIHFGF